MPASQLTVRNVPAEIASRLRELSASRGESINSTVLHILRQALDFNERRKRLARYATWSDRDAAEFDEALRCQREVDETLWK